MPTARRPTRGLGFLVRNVDGVRLRLDACRCRVDGVLVVGEATQSGGRPAVFVVVIVRAVARVTLGPVIAVVVVVIVA